MTMKLKNEDKVLIGGGLLALGTMGFLYWKKKKKENEEASLLEETPIAQTAPTTTQSTPKTGATLDKNKLLYKGSKGLEVRELQRLLGVAIDGDFGNNTLKALQSKKGASKISLNAYLKTALKPTIKEKPTALVLPKVGQKLMANADNVSLFNAKRTASGTYFNAGTKPFIGASFDYGEHIGVFVASKVGGQYLIKREDVYYFVNANAVKAY